MRTATGRGSRRLLQRLVLPGVAILTIVLPRVAPALVLDDRGEMRLGMRTYTAVRIGTEKMGGETDPLSFPNSAPGHVRQHRYFLEMKLDHDVRRLSKTGWGLARLFGWIDPNTLKYSLQYRGEGEGIYDYGPDEFSHEFRKTSAVRLNLPNTIGTPLENLARLSPILPKAFVKDRVDKLRRLARQRHRFFLGYVDFEKGPVFARVGRQILAWGETDVFRLLDNINPLDDSFGGFFIPLDERRLPLDMVRTSYHFGSLGPLNDAFLEGFAAFGNRVSTFPGIPAGSPWEPGGLGFPNPALHTMADVPDRTEVRGGGRLVFNYKDVTYTLAHYYTYLDIPGVQFRLPGRVQLPGETAPSNTARFHNEIQAIQRFPRVPITGASLTFPLERFYSIVRSEAAYFQDEPMNRQGRGNSADALCPSPFCPDGAAGVRRLRQQNNTEGGLDPFVYPRFLDITREGPVWGKVLQRDTFNFAVGLDVNRFVRWLNAHQTMFITTQFFYKHVFDSPGDLVLPVPFRSISVDKSIPFVGTAPPLGVGCKVANGRTVPCYLRPRLLHLDDDRFLQTLLITTSYSSGRIIPSYGMFYDWQGAFVFQPGLTYVYDPFRFITDYTRIEGAPTGQFGAVRDRDNVRFQVEFVF
jgi:hypothetical protein